MLKALIFDFDGTILDTETPEFENWQRLYREHEHELEIADWGRGIGTWGAFDPWAHLETKLGYALDRDAIHASQRPRLLEALHTQPIQPGVHDLFLEVRKQGLKLAIASSSDIDWVRGWTEHLGIYELFDAFATRYEVEHVKPDPALYTLALNKLGLEPNQAIAIEDSPNGAKAALAAGLTCVIVPNPVTRTLEFPNGVHRFETLENVTLENLQALLN
jgi:HAD superfamily hydrolase (TIGR01509 family)